MDLKDLASKYDGARPLFFYGDVILQVQLRCVLTLQHVNLLFKAKKPNAKASGQCAVEALQKGIIESRSIRATVHHGPSRLFHNNCSFMSFQVKSYLLKGIWEGTKGKHELLIRLYYFQIMHNGYVAFEVSADSANGDPIDTGLTPLQHLEGSVAVGTLSEHFIRESVVPEILAANHHQMPVDQDPILEVPRLLTLLTHGSTLANT